MKTGKYIPLGTYQNVKIGYGTVDFKNLKTIYLKLNSWIQADNETDDFDLTINKTRRKVKEIIYNLKNPNFKQQSIVDLDVRTKGIKLEKRSFMNLEVTLYVDKQFDVKSKETKNNIKDILLNVIDEGLSNKKLFNFYKSKK
jgi:AAA15 family ATPase/GTPase